MTPLTTRSGSGNKVKDVLARVVEVSTLPEVAMKIMKVADDPDAGAADILRVLETDPALSSRVLRTLRSAKYGLKTEIVDLHQAIGYLGFKEIRNLAMAGSISTIFQTELQIGNYSRAGLWNHSVGVATCAKMLASRLKLPNFEDAYIAGLLHDLGIVLVDEHQNQRFQEILAAVAAETPLASTERKVLGFDHMRLGGALAEKWKFPRLVRDSMEYHHHSGRLDGPSWRVVACVETADFVCSVIGLTAVGVNTIQAPKKTFLRLDLTKSDLVVLAEDLKDRLNDNSLMLSG